MYTYVNMTKHNKIPWFNSKLNNFKVLFRQYCKLFRKSHFTLKHNLTTTK